LQANPDRTDELVETEHPLCGRKNLPGKVDHLRQQLYLKAKREPGYCFYTLFEAVCRPDVLGAAWDLVAANDGAPGLDGVSIEQVQNSDQGVSGFLSELGQSLKDRTYRPQPVKRVYIPKANGKLRPLGIPTIRDRVAQMAVLLIVEPIFEADFLDCSFGFRPGRSAHQALDEIRINLKQGRREVYDADLQAYFDTIPHENLMACLRRRISDGSVLKLIRMWLEAVVVEPGDGPGKPPKVSRSKQGTPQGGVISPLLANLYLHWFDKKFHGPNGPFAWANARLVRYADDFVIMAKYVTGPIERFVEQTLEKHFGLKVNREKTRIVNLDEPGASLDFLGYTYRYDRDLGGGSWTYLNLFPSAKALQRERDKLKEMTGPKKCFLPTRVLMVQINQHMRGWKNYFGQGYPRGAFRKIEAFARERLIRHLKRRSQRPYRPPEGVTWYAQLHRLGLAL
jgi:RNA-directed DNA polymerase